MLIIRTIYRYMVISAVFLCVCSNSQPTAGGGTETTNGITVSIRDTHIIVNNPDTMTVGCYPFTYNPAHPGSAVAETTSAPVDTFGRTTGRYALYFWNKDRSVLGVGGSLEPAMGVDTTFEIVGTPPGFITGTVTDAPPGSSTSITILLPGTPYYATLNHTSVFSIGPLAVNEYRILAEVNGIPAAVLTAHGSPPNRIRVTAGDTSHVGAMTIQHTP